MITFGAAELHGKVAAALPANSLRARFVLGAFWSIIAAALSQGMAFISYVLAARILSKTEFGELGIIQSTVGLFGVFAGMGLGLTATKHVAEYRCSAPARAGRIITLTMLVGIGMSAVAAATLALWSPVLASYTLKAPHLAPELRIGCVLLLLNTIDGVQSSVLTGFEAFSLIARTNVLRGIANLALVSGGVYHFGLRGALCGLVAAAAVGLIINHFALRSQAARFGVTLEHRGLSGELPTLWGYAIPAFVSGALATPAGWLARTLLVSQPGGYAEMAVFTVASRFQDVINLTGQTLGSALLPILASERGSKSDRLNRGNILLSWLIGTAAVLPLLTFPELVGMLFGGQYATRNAIQTFVLVLLCTLLVMYKQGLARILAANNLMWWGALSNFTWAATLVAGAWALVYAGARGLATALLLSYALNTVIFMPLYLRKCLAPASLLASPAVSAVWVAVLAPAAASYVGASAAQRCIAGGLSVVAISLAFARLLAAKGGELPANGHS